MKKLSVFIVVCILLSFTFLSCKKDPGKVTGTVTYFFNNYQGYKPDIGSTVYVTKQNCDSLEMYINASCYDWKITYMKSLNDDGSYTEISNIYQTRFNEIVGDTSNYKKITNAAILTFIDIHGKINKGDYMTTVNANGEFMVDVPPGEYNLLIVSSGRKTSVTLGDGDMKVRKCIVKSGETTNVSVKFEVDNDNN